MSPPPLSIPGPWDERSGRRRRSCRSGGWPQLHGGLVVLVFDRPCAFAERGYPFKSIAAIELMRPQRSNYREAGEDSCVQVHDSIIAAERLVDEPRSGLGRMEDERDVVL